MDVWVEISAQAVCVTLFRYREPVITVDDAVNYTEKDVTFQKVDEDGDLVDTPWKIPVREYKVTPADPEETADRWSYLDPEAGHQPTTWATGLTLSVSCILSNFMRTPDGINNDFLI